MIVESEGVADQIISILSAVTSKAQSFHVTLNGIGKLQWKTIEDGQPKTYHREPLACCGNQLLVKPLSLFPIEDQL